MNSRAKQLVRHLDDVEVHIVGRAQPGLDHNPRDEGQGEIRKLISRELSGSEDLHLAVATVSPGDHHIKHYHPNGSEWYFILRGQLVVYVGDDEIVADPGTMIYLPPGTVHGARNDSGDTAEMLVGLSLPEYAEMGRIYVDSKDPADHPHVTGGYGVVAGQDGNGTDRRIEQVSSKYVSHLREEDFVPLTETDPGGDNAKIDSRDEGAIAKLITRRLMGSEDVSVSVARVYPGEYHLRHHHPEGSEFYYFRRGECIVHVDGEDVVAHPGTAIYLPPNTVHSIRNDGGEVVELVCGLSRPEYAEIGLVYDE